MIVVSFDRWTSLINVQRWQPSIVIGLLVFDTIIDKLSEEVHEFAWIVIHH